MRHLASDRPRRRGLLLLAIILLLASSGIWVWTALRVGPPPTVSITSSRPAIGAAATVIAAFKEPTIGLGSVRLELIQGEHTVTLAEQRFTRPGVLSLGRGPITGGAELSGVVGREAQPWLAEGEAIIRATADIGAGSWRSPAPVVVEKRLPVRLHPPRLEVLSSQHNVRQGGSGAVTFRTDEAAERSGVRAGAAEFLSFAAGTSPGDRFVIFAVPWDDTDRSSVKLFAEDAAGNRVESDFLTTFKPAPARHDRIELTSAFLDRVVPAITAETPGLDASGTMLERYLRINRELRKENLARLAELCRTTEHQFLWRAAFLQLPNSARRASFAETRDYLFEGSVVDHQTHLGLDLASNSHAAVPAANAGKVLLAGPLGIYGHVVLLDHGYGVATLYGHLSVTEVTPGQVVARGQRIGATGTTGLAGGDHLHFEVFIQGHSADPMEWLDGKWLNDNLGTKLVLPQ